MSSEVGPIDVPSFWDTISIDAAAVGASFNTPTFGAAGIGEATGLFGLHDLESGANTFFMSGGYKSVNQIPASSNMYDVVIGGAVSAITVDADGNVDTELGVGATFVLNGGKNAFFVNLRYDTPLPDGTPETALSLNMGFLFNGVFGTRALLGKIPAAHPAKFVVQKALDLLESVSGVWGGFAMRLEVVQDDAGGLVFYKGGQQFDLVTYIEQIEALFNEINAALGDEDAIALTLETVARFEEIAEVEEIEFAPTSIDPATLTIISDQNGNKIGEVVQNADATQTWYQGKDGSNITLWDDENGTNLAVTYADGTVYIESSEGLQTLYDANGDVVRQSLATGSSDRVLEAQEWMQSGEGMLFTPPPSFFSAFPYSNELILTSLFGEGSTAQVSTVMTAEGLAKVVTQDGVAKYVVFGDGRIENLQNLGNKIAGEGIDELASILDVSEVLFEFFRKDEAGNSVLQTWETQYKAPIDAFIDELLLPQNSILFDDVRGIPGLGARLTAAIEAYRLGDGAFRFVANIIGIADSDLGSNGTFDGAIDGLVTLLNTDSDLSNDDKSSFSGVLLASAFAYQAVRGAQQAFSAGGDVIAQLGFANDTVLALGSLAALGVIDEDYAKFAALSYGGYAAFAAVNAALDTSRQNPDSLEDYTEAVASAVSLISQLGRMGVIDESITDAVVGTYNVYKVVETGLDVYENWGVDTPQVMTSVGGFLTALNTLGNIGWLSEDAAKIISDATDVYNIANTGYAIATQGINLGNAANFTLAIAAVLVDEDDLDAQAGLAVVNIVAGFATANPVQIFVGVVSFFNIMSLNSKKEAAEREARYEATRYQLAQIGNDVDADGNGVSLDDVQFEYNIGDDFIYLLGDPADIVSTTSYSLETNTVRVVRVNVNGNEEYRLLNDYIKPFGIGFLYVPDPHRGPTLLNPDAFLAQTSLGLLDGVGNIRPMVSVLASGYIGEVFDVQVRELKLVRTFNKDAMGAYANEDVRVIQNYDSPNSKWVRDELHKNHRTLDTNKFLTDEEYQQLLNELGGVSGTLSESEKPEEGTAGFNEYMAKLTAINTVLPVPADTRVAFIQSNENLGLTLFENINDDNRDGALGPVDIDGDGVVDQTDILDKVTTFANLGGEIQGDNSKLIQLLNDKGETYLAFALSADSSGPTVTSSFDYVETAKLTQAARALKPWGQVDPLNMGFNLKAENKITSPTQVANALDVFGELLEQGNGDKWMVSDDGRLLAIYATQNIQRYIPTITEAYANVPTYLVFNAEKQLIKYVDNPFADLDINVLLPWDDQWGGGFFEAIRREVEVAKLYSLLNIANTTSAENPPVDIQVLGFDPTGLSIGEVEFGGLKVLGIKDYSKAPMQEAEKMIYLSYIAGRLAVDPQSWREMGEEVINFRDPDAAAIAARIYVANNTPRDEFYANDELPDNVFFDPQAYLLANPHVLNELSNDSSLDFDVMEVFESLRTASLSVDDYPVAFQLLQAAAHNYIKVLGSDEDPMFAAYAADFNADVRKDDQGNIVSGEVDILRVNRDGVGIASISTEGENPDIPYVIDIVMKYGKLQGMRMDVDGDGIVDNIFAPDADGGVWRAELSSGAVGEARSSESAQRLALAGDALQAGGVGVRVDVNADGVVDLAQVLTDGTGRVTLGYVDANAPGGVSLSTTFYSGETLQDAVAQANALQLLAWVGGDIERIASVGSDITAAQVAFSRNPSYDTSINLGQFALENAALIQANGSDLVAALISHIDTTRSEVLASRLADITSQLSLARDLQEVLTRNLDEYLENGYEYNAGLETTLIVNALMVFKGREDALDYKLNTLTYDSLFAAAREIDEIFFYNKLGYFVPLDERAEFEKEFTEGPLSNAIDFIELDIMRLENEQADLQRFVAGELDIIFDYSTIIADRMTDLAGGMMDELAGTNQNVPQEFSLSEMLDSLELQSSMAKLAGYDVGTSQDDVYRPDYAVAVSYNGFAGDDRIFDSEFDDILKGGDGNDRITASLGNDTLYGGSGQDNLWSGDGDDLIFGGTGRDGLLGQNGDDILIGGTGDDLLKGGTGSDILVGGAGRDTFTGDLPAYLGDVYADTYVYGEGGGRDVFTDFRAQDADVIALDIAGIDNFNTVMQYARQNFTDTLFNFGNGDSILLLNVDISTLTPENFVFDHVDVNARIAARLEATTIAEVPNLDPLLTDDIGFVVENGSDIVLSVQEILNNDSDPDGDTLSLVSVQNALNGSVSLNASGEILFSPDAGFEGPASFDYTVSDSQGGRATATVNMTVNPVPTPDPAIVNGDVGDDMLTANVAGSVVNGFDGNDVLVGDVGDDTLNGGSGDDRLFGNDGQDSLYGDTGNDSLYGRSGNDILRGGTGNDLLYGGDGADSLVGDAGDDSLYGDAGNDQLHGGAGNDDVIGGDGDDTLLGGTGDDLIYGGLGQDYLDGEDGADKLFGFAGNDEIYGGAGDDFISGDAGLDRLHGNAGNDTLNGGEGNDLLYGGDGNDELTGGAGGDLLEGGTGNDVLNGQQGNDTIYAGTGDDQLRGGAGADYLHGDEGIDTAIFDGERADYRIESSTAPDTYIITELADPTNVNTLIGIENVSFNGISYAIETVLNSVPVAANDDGLSVLTGQTLTLHAAVLLENDVDLDGDVLSVLSVQNPVNGLVVLDGTGNISFTPDSGFLGTASFQYTVSDGHGATSDATVEIWVRAVPTAGDDELHGMAGVDVIYAGDGDDTVFGGDGDDWLYGEAGNDTVSGGAGKDMLYAGSGDDIVSGGDGDDRLYGNSGNNTLNGDDGNDAMYGGTGVDILNGGAGDDWIYGGVGSANDTLNGDEGDDTLFGREGDDILSGGAGNDSLYGEYGDDVLSGGTGNDRLFGEHGNDTLSGGMAFDWLYGGMGDDLLYGDSGVDDLFGGLGNDVLSGGTENDDLYGEGGDDILDGGAGADRLDGGAGFDVAYYSGERSQYLVELGVDAGTYIVTDLLDLENTDTLTGIETLAFNTTFFAIESLFNAAPVAEDDTGFTIQSGAVLTLTAASILANDSDSDGDDLSLVSVSGASNGTVFLNEEGDVIFTPDAGYQGAASFTYTVSDGNGGTSTASVNLSVLAPVSAASDVITGGFGDDTVSGGAGDDQINGGTGNDTINGDEGSDYVYGGEGADIVEGGLGNDFVFGDEGNDIVSGGAGNDWAYGGLGDDVVSGGDGADRVYGDDGNDTLSGGLGVDRLYGGNGEDNLSGGDAIDYLYGGAGADILNGDLGNDHLRGDNGDDLILGGEGNDSLYGLNDNDTLHGGLGDDRLYGGNGVDTLNGDAGTDRLYGNDGTDTLNGGDGNDTLYGGNQDDILNGDAGNDTLYGDNGNDVISGGAGWDKLYGFVGDDTLIGGAANDTLSGGVGNDTFVFDANFGADIIRDFSEGAGSEDIIDFSGNGALNSFADVLAVAYQSGSSTVIDLGSEGKITLLDVNLTLLHEDDFKFA